MTQEQEQTPLPGAGPDLDRRVAAKMGYEWEPFESGSGPSGEWVIPGTNRTAYDVRWIHRTGLFQPQYSTDISAAWEIVEFMKEKGYWFSLETHFHPVSTTDLDNKEVIFIEYAAEFYPAIDLLIGEKPNDYGQVAETGPMAICLAFLALPGFEVKP